MATPHVAGAVALLWSAQPSLRNDVDATENILNQTAVHLNPPFPPLCDSVETTWPNNVFGYGRLDVKAAVDQALLLPTLLSAVSRKSHPGAGNFDIALPFGGDALGIECRDSGGNHTLVFTFNNDVVSGNASVTNGTGTAAAPTFSGKTMTVNLTGVTNLQTITVTLNDVTDNLSQVLPDTNVKMGVLVGDVNATKRTDSGDVTAVRNHTVSVPTDNATARFDVNVSGRIDAGDVTATRNATVTVLP
jgi:hypothetical protein